MNSTIRMMDIKYPEKFQEMCTQLILSGFPEAKAVSGKGGDEGVDAYVGEFHGDIHVFQFKFFFKPLLSSQKKQIINSLKTAKQKHKLKRWTLIIAKDLTPREIDWFNNLKNQNKDVMIDWWGESKLELLLNKCPEIREAFFPRIDSQRIREIHNILVNKEIVKSMDYTILSIDDVSHGLAKRMTCNILVDSNLTKDQIKSIVTSATFEIINTSYSRNKLVKDAWGNVPAQVIWLFVYKKLDDVHYANWICRCLWIYEGLEKQYRPLEIGYDNEFDGILIDWNETYELQHKLYVQSSGSKQDYLDSLDIHFTHIKSFYETAIRIWDEHKEGKITEDKLIDKMHNLTTPFSIVESEASNILLPPLECRGIDDVFQAFIASVSNVYLCFTSRGLDLWSKEHRNYLISSNLNLAEKKLFELKYEIGKIK